MPNLIGQSLGRYHILEQLGEGGMAVVYKAYDTRLESDVAVKVIRVEKITPEVLARTLIRFEREAKALARLTHANIVKVIDYGEYEGQPYLVMPYLPGGTLKDLLKQGRMPWQDAVRLLLPVARALEFAHQEGMIHRDVKPSNILITRSGDPMLTDFGIAKIIGEDTTQDLTGTNAMLGTPEYMAPEQGLGKPVDQRADLYALGVVFYEMVTGRRPYVADTPIAVMLKKATEPLPRPSQFVPGLPESVENFLLKSLTRDPVNRYQSAGEMITGLEGLLAGKRIIAPVTEKGGKPRKSKRFLLWLAGGAGILLLVILCVIGGVIALPRFLSKSTASPTTGIPIASPTLVSQGLPSLTNISLPTDTFLPTVTQTLTPTLQESWKQGRIVYVEMNEENLNDIYMLDLTLDADPRLLLASRTGQQLYGPSLSPDSSKVVYYDANRGNNGILDVNTLKVQSFPYCNSPSFSTDGSRIICGEGSQFQFLNASGDPVGSPLDVRQNGRLPAWSPDGSEVAFAVVNGKSSSIWKISSSGGQAIPLASDAFENYAPTWSPDGQWIAYQSGDGSGLDEIWIMDQNGGNKQQLTHTPVGWSRSPVWSPDGKWLAFVSGTGNVDPDFGDIFVISLLTEEQTQVTHTGGRMLDWRVSWGQ